LQNLDIIVKYRGSNPFLSATLAATLIISGLRLFRTRFLFAKIRVWQYIAAPPFSQKVTFALAIRLQAPSLTPLAHYQPFAGVPAAHIFLWFGITDKPT
jgi:hypothetical protein